MRTAPALLPIEDKRCRRDETFPTDSKHICESGLTIDAAPKGLIGIAGEKTIRKAREL